MTMILRSIVTVPVKPVAGKKGWFEFCGRPLRSECHDTEEWRDLYGGGNLVKGALVVGLHDDVEITEGDPRFNHHSLGECVVVRDPNFAEGHLMALTVNAPEARVFEFMFDLDGQPGASDFPRYKPGAVEAEQAHLRQRRAEYEARRAALKKPAAKPRSRARA